MNGRTWLIGVWLVLGSVLVGCSWTSDRSAALNGAAGQDASGASGASGMGGRLGAGGAGGARTAGTDGGVDMISEADTAPSTDGTTDIPVEKCVPSLCQTAGGSYCGTFPDGCGGLAMCGDNCPKGQTCGGGGIAHVCGGDPNCKPVVCSGPGYQFCGTIGDGCGKSLTCGDCTAPKTCGGGGTKNVCGS